jgi:DNA-binding transcriptional LysR family regulator
MERWFGVEVRHLAALAAIDAERSFRGAADELGYVQSAVSQQISTLERLVGARLVERARGHSHVALTGAGQLLAERAHAILAQLDAACTDVRAHCDDRSPRLRIGASQSIATSVLPGTLAKLAARHPDTTVEVSESLSEVDLFARVEGGGLDIALAELPLQGGPFQMHSLVVDPTMLVVPADGRRDWADVPPTLADIGELNLIRATSWRMLPLIDAELAARGITSRSTLSSTTDAGVQALVAAGLGAALMPSLAIDCDYPRIEVVDLDGLLPARKLVAFYRQERELSPALTAVVLAARAASREALARRSHARGIATAPAASMASLAAA